MAYCEKITVLRRLAMINKCGLVIWEGVQIDNNKIIIKKTYSDNIIACISTIDLNEFEEDNNCITVFQDDANTRLWEPRAKCYYDNFRYKYVDISPLFNILNI